MIWTIIIAVAFAVARFVVPVEGKISHDDVFKDLAHLFVGGCFGAAILATANRRRLGQWLSNIDVLYEVAEAKFHREALQLWVVAIGLTVLEIVAFVVRKI